MPYAIQRLLDKRNLCHFAIPLVRTEEFKFTFAAAPGIAKDAKRHGRTDNTSVHRVIFLGTISEKPNLPEDQGGFELSDRLFKLQLLMRIAAEPLSDEYFYGGIINQKLKSEGRGEGSIEPLRTFGHQVKNIGKAIHSGWLVDLNRWEQIKLAFPENEYGGLLSKVMVAPAPELFYTLQKLVHFWSLGSRLEDNFFSLDSATNGSNVPKDLRDVANQAWDLAIGRRLLRDSSNATFGSSNKALRFVWNHQHRAHPDFNEIASWTINSTFDSSAASGHLLTLSGILRVLVVAFENFIDHTNDVSATLRISVEECESSLFLNCKNSCETNGSEKSSISRTGIAFLGLDIIKYICETLLKPKVEQNFWNSVDFIDDSEYNVYTLRVPIGLPVFLIKEES